MRFLASVGAASLALAVFWIVAIFDWAAIEQWRATKFGDHPWGWFWLVGSSSVVVAAAVFVVLATYDRMARRQDEE